MDTTYLNIRKHCFAKATIRLTHIVMIRYAPWPVDHWSPALPSQRGDGRGKVFFDDYGSIGGGYSFGPVNGVLSKAIADLTSPKFQEVDRDTPIRYCAPDTATSRRVCLDVRPSQKQHKRWIINAIVFYQRCIHHFGPRAARVEVDVAMNGDLVFDTLAEISVEGTFTDGPQSHYWNHDE